MDLTALQQLRWPLALPLVAVVTLLALGWWSRRARTTRPDDAVWLAGTEQLRRLPRYRALLRRQRLLGLVQLGGALLVVAGAAVVLARPQLIEERGGSTLERDVMLCLDASASMDDDNAAVVAEVGRVVADLDGDRVGLMVWSGAAVLVFPLTDDADYVQDQLGLVAESLTSGDGLLFAGVDPPARRSSLIGDGLASCLGRFDRGGEDRTRAVLLTSDNDPLGTPAFFLPEAAEHAIEDDVVVYGLGAPELATPERAAAREEMSLASEGTGGSLAVLGDDGSASDLVDRIEALEQARAQVRPRDVAYDAPTAGLLLVGLGAALLALAWALRARWAR